MDRLYVIDTCVIISYFNDIFNGDISVSVDALKILNRAFNNDIYTKISIPSIVFVEIFEKWCKNEEITRKIWYEIIRPIFEKDNLEIRELDFEVLESIVDFDDDIENIELNDKIIVATAQILDCPLITSDRKIIKYNRKDKKIQNIIK